MILSDRGRHGIYLIRCYCNSKIYIGSAVCLYSRTHVHLHNLRKDTHANIHLLRAFKRYGERSFLFAVLEYVNDKNDLLKKEQEFIDYYKPNFNLLKIAGNSLGYKMTKEQKEHMSKIRLGRQTTGMLGKKHTEEAKKKISEKAKARGLHPSFIAASKASNTGRKHTIDNIQKRVQKQMKLNELQIIEIKKLRREGFYQKDIAKMFSISQRLVVRVLKGIGIYGSY